MPRVYEKIKIQWQDISTTLTKYCTVNDVSYILLHLSYIYVSAYSWIGVGFFMFAIKETRRAFVLFHLSYIWDLFIYIFKKYSHRCLSCAFVLLFLHKCLIFYIIKTN